MKPLVVIPVVGDEERFADLQKMEFSPDGRHIVVRRSWMVGELQGDTPALLEVYDATTAKLVRSVKLDHGGRGRYTGGRPGFTISPAGDWIAYADDRNVNFVSLPPRKSGLPPVRGAYARFPHEGFARAGVWANGDGTAVFAETGLGGGYTLYRIDITQAKVVQAEPILTGGRESAEPARVASFALNPAAGRFAAVGESDAGKPIVECWTLGAKPKQTAIPATHHPNSLALSSDGKAVAIGYPDASLAWHDPDTGNVIHRVRPLGWFPVHGLAFHPGGKYLACGTTDKRGQANLFCLNVATGEVVARVVADQRGVLSVGFSPGGDRLATFGAAGEIRIWNATALLKLERD